MRIKILGSGREVGRSSIILESDKKIMLDCGVKIEPEPQYPQVERGISAAFMSHAHLDHIGAAPMLFKKDKPKLFMNDITLELGMMLIKDSMKVAEKEGFNIPFSSKHVRKMVKGVKTLSYKEKTTVGDMSFSLWHSGHIPGSSSILTEAKGKRVLYTSDIQTIDTHLMRKAQPPSNIDTLIIESTYGHKNHGPREKAEREMIQYVEEAIGNNETVLFPVFAVGRAQEVMLILQEHANIIAIDGMARQASEIIEEYGAYVKDVATLRAAMKKAFFVKRGSDRGKILDNKRIIITSAGMLGGGPAVHYLREIRKRRDSKVFFTGFLLDDTPGKILLETNKFRSDEEEFDVNCEVRQFELSAHTDRNGIFDIIRKTNAKQVICVHGERCKDLAHDIEKELNIPAFAPRNGEEVKV